MSVLRRIPCGFDEFGRNAGNSYTVISNVDNGAGSGEQATGKHLSFVPCTLIFVIQPSGAEAQLNERALRGPEGRLFHERAGVCRLFATAEVLRFPTLAVRDACHSRRLPFANARHSRCLPIPILGISPRLRPFVVEILSLGQSLFEVLGSAKPGHHYFEGTLYCDATTCHLPPTFIQISVRRS
jgi:hypothetical protein